MLSPKSHKHKERKLSYRKREHKNKKFYNSQAWRDTREAYMRYYQLGLFNSIPDGKWGEFSLSGKQVMFLLSMITSEWLPCETCLSLYAQKAYDTVEKGVELDHIVPVNRDNAMESEEYGDPFGFRNLQLLCKRHHAKKSQRER